MSLLNDASLVMIPSGYKDTKLYSVKPTNGDGDFTFSRGSNLAATRVNSEGLIEKGRENQILYSNTFSSWSTSGSPILTGGQSGYDGSSDAWLFDANSGGYIISVQSSSGVNTFSIYAKAGTNDFLFLYNVRTGADPTAYFNLSNGTTGTSTNCITTNIVSVGNDWYRCSMTFTDGDINLRVYSGSAEGSLSDGTIYIQDAQNEQGLVATDYIETTTTTAQAGILEDMPRLDYSGGASCPSLLLEPSRTNLVTSSEWLEGSFSLANFATFSLENVTAPDGSNLVTKVQANSSDDAGRAQDSLGTLGTNHIWSGFFKGTGTATRIRFRNNQGDRIDYNIDADGNFTFNAGNAANGNYDIEDYGNGWYRIWFETTTSGATTNYIQIYPDIIDGDGSVYAWGLQAEEGSYPTSYIPTYGASVTRSADSCSKTGISSLIGQSEGTMFIDFDYKINSGNMRFSLSDNSGVNWIFISTPENGTTNASRFYYRANNVVQIDNGATSYFTYGQRYKLAFAYKSGDWAIYGNGTLLYSGTNTLDSFTLPLQQVNFVQANAGTANEKLPINQSIVFKTRLSNDELAELTTI